MTHTPTPAEIETLRKIVAGRTCTEHDQRAAVAILDRLSPPAPEVDEATKIWREMNARGFNALADYESAKECLIGDYDDHESAGAEISYLRTALSELIASKDAEIERLKGEADEGEKLAEQYHNIAEDIESELAALRAENERLKDTIADLGVDLDEWQRCERAAGNIPSPKAAERNPAGPGPWPGDPDHRETMPVDTAPVVDAPVDSGMGAEAVEQAELFWAQLPVNRKWISIPTHEKALVCHLLSTYRTEAEARGRRQALENIELIPQRVKAMIGATEQQQNALNYCEAELRSYKHLMTEGK